MQKHQNDKRARMIAHKESVLIAREIQILKANDLVYIMVILAQSGKGPSW